MHLRHKLTMQQAQKHRGDYNTGEKKEKMVLQSELDYHGKVYNVVQQA